MRKTLPGQRHNYLLLWEHGKDLPSCAYLVKRPGVGEKGFYRESVSFSYWRERELVGAYPQTKSKKKPTPFHFVSMTYEDYAMHVASWKRTCVTCKIPEPDYRAAEEFDSIFWFNDKQFVCPTFTSIYDFYAHIGYDYKRQKYLDGKGVKAWLNL